MRFSWVSPLVNQYSVQCRQRVRLGKTRFEVVFNQLGRDLLQQRRRPARLAVLVDQQRAYALGEVGVGAAAQRDAVFQAEHLGQRQVVHPLPQREGQRRRGRRALGKGGGRILQPRVVAVQAAQPRRNVQQVVAGHQCVDLVEVPA